MKHPNQEALTMLAYGFLGPSEEAAARAHLAECFSCRALWDASCGEASAVRISFEPAQARAPKWVAWAGGFAAGFAAAALVSVSLGRREPATEAKVTPPGITVMEFVKLTPCEDAQYFYTGTEGRQLAGRVVYELKYGTSLTVEAGRVVLTSKTPGTHMEVAMRQELKGGIAGVITIAVAVGIIEVRDGNAETVLKAGDVAAIPAEGAPIVLRAGDDPSSRLKDLEARKAEIERQLALRSTPPPPDDRSPAAAARRLAARFAAIVRRDGFGDVTRRMLAQLFITSQANVYELPPDVDSYELRYSPRLDRFLVALFDESGCPPAAGQRAAFEELLAKEEASWSEYLKNFGDRTFLERTTVGMRAWDTAARKFDELLTDDQRKVASEVRKVFGDPVRNDLTIWIRVADVNEGLSAVREVARRGLLEATERDTLGITDEDLVLREYVIECLAIDDELGQNLKSAELPSDPEHHLRALELRVRTTQRLISEFGVSREDARAWTTHLPGILKRKGE